MNNKCYPRYALSIFYNFQGNRIILVAQLTFKIFDTLRLENLFFFFLDISKQKMFCKALKQDKNTKVIL